MAGDSTAIPPSLCYLLIVLPNTDLQAGQPVFATASFGMTLLDPDVNIEESMDRADKAMYGAKAAGRNCVRVWEPFAPSESGASDLP